MSKQLRELQSRKATLVKDARALTDIAAAEQRDMNEEEISAFEALKARIEATSAAIDREAALIAEEAQMGHAAQLPNGSVITVVSNAESDPKHGFKSVGEFLKTVRHAQNPGSSIDDRLLIGMNRGAVAPASFGSEGAAQDGGFLVPPQFAQEIFQLSLGEDSLLPMTDNVEITGNTMAFPKDETTPWGTNGIRAYWQGEATPAAGTKPVLGLASLRLKKLMALVPVTDELLDDTNALSTYLPDKIATSIRWKTNESILFGSGTGVPTGCMSGGYHRDGGQGVGADHPDPASAEPRQDDLAPAAGLVCQGRVDRQQRRAARALHPDAGQLPDLPAHGHEPGWHPGLALRHAAWPPSLRLATRQHLLFCG